MSWIAQHLWLIPVLPLLAAVVLSVTSRPHRLFAASMSIGTMGLAFLLALWALCHALSGSAPGGEAHEVFNFEWFRFGDQSLRLGWVLDPLAAVMLAMVTFVGLLIFIYSAGYMAHDGNFTRFFCFLSLFAAAMLGLVISNNLLLLFMCWELVGLASYLLIGFWYHKPSAAAAANKAFITTRIGDVLFFLGILYWYWKGGTLLFYDAGNGCLEPGSLSALSLQVTGAGLAVTTAIGLLIFCGAIGKSGQVPLHVWLPDAMEGPTPVSALIHAATMVAAGVFLIARVYPLMSAHAGGAAGETAALEAVTWVGAVTALFAASIAVAQTDIKRILAYSTVSQLGFMFMGLGTGGPAVGMFHLITHAFFKALLFLGAGSVIHGCHEEQDIRRMGGLRKQMPATFATYAVGMMALSGVPLLFSGFWSKDGILEAARFWKPTMIPFYLGAAGSFLTAFYMTRQMFYVFAGKYRGDPGIHVHESPPLMTIPLRILAVFAVGLGFLGTPAWPWFQGFLENRPAKFDLGELFSVGFLATMGISAAIVFVGIYCGWRLYGARGISSPEEPDALQQLGEETFFLKDVFTWLQRKFYVDEFYEATVIRFNSWWSRFCAALDEYVWDNLVRLTAYAVLGLSWVDRFFDENVINRGFDEGCREARAGGKLLSRLQNSQVQRYLRIAGLSLVVLLLLLMWGCGAP